MNKIMAENPFVVGRYEGDELFCDREDETTFLNKQMANGRNVALISPRRLGKTGLIEHFMAQDSVQQRYHTFFIDIYATRSLSELAYLLGKTIFAALKPRPAVWRERFFEVVKSLRAAFKVDAITGEPSLEVSLGDITQPDVTLEEIFSYLNQADKPCIVAIDEFQQIGAYKESNVEALLRTHMQHCANALFIFAGSKRHMMSNMFNSPAKPFYQSALVMGLQPLPMATYAAWAADLFAQRGRSLDADVVPQVYGRYEGTTWYVQMIMNELFALTAPGSACTASMIPVALSNVVRSQQEGYMALLEQLSAKQKAVLLALAAEGKASQVASGAFVRRHRLGSPSSVQSALRTLLNNEIVTRNDGVYRVSDYFLADWLVTYY